MIGCAPKGLRPQALAELAKADLLLRAGCYSCLTEALAIYQKHKVAQGIFDAALLIAIREKELGIPSDDAMAARARRRAADLARLCLMRLN